MYEGVYYCELYHLINQEAWYDKMVTCFNINDITLIDLC